MSMSATYNQYSNLITKHYIYGHKIHDESLLLLIYITLLSYLYLHVGQQPPEGFLLIDFRTTSDTICYDLEGT